MRENGLICFFYSRKKNSVAFPFSYLSSVATGLNVQGSGYSL